MIRAYAWLTGCALLLLIGQSAQATLITFDNFAPTVVDEIGPGQPTVSGYAAVRNGALSAMIVSVDGMTVTITRETGRPFDVVDNDPTEIGDSTYLHSQQGKSPAFGKRSLDPFADTSNNGFVFSFSDPIRSFSLLAGDYGYDVDSLRLQAYSGPDLTGGTALPQVYDYLPYIGAKQWTEQRFYTAVGSVNDPGFQSVLFKGGLSDMSVFVDRIWFDRGVIEPPPTAELNHPANTGSNAVLVPEPSTLALLGLGALALARRRR